MAGLSLVASGSQQFQQVEVTARTGIDDWKAKRLCVWEVILPRATKGKTFSMGIGSLRNDVLIRHRWDSNPRGETPMD